jgi:plastocyanin
MPVLRRLSRPLALVLLLAACGGGGGGGPAGPSNPQSPGTPNNPSQGAPSASATITMTTTNDIYGESVSQFAPASVTIARNGTVTFSNTSNVSHNVTFASVAGAPADVPSGGAGSASRTFATAGTFGLSCTNHVGMSGTVTVVP